MRAVRCFRSDDAFHMGLQDLCQTLDCNAQLPHWPFTASSGWIRIYEYDRVLGPDLGTVLEALAREYEDQHVTVMTLDPEMSYYRDEYEFFPGFQVLENNERAGYGVGLRHEPQGDPTGALAYTANILAIAGSSGAWAIWAQRDWESFVTTWPTWWGG